MKIRLNCYLLSLISYHNRAKSKQKSIQSDLYEIFFQNEIVSFLI